MERLNKKLITVLAVLLIGALVLSGCGSKPAGQTSEQEQQKASKSNYPEKPITMIIPWAAGGGTDIVMRKLADLMAKDLGQPFVVQNVAGGGGQVGFKQIASSNPDGYTVGAITVSMTIQKLTAAGVGADAFTFIDMVNMDPAVLTVKADAPYSDVKGFVEAAKKNPGKFRVANAGAKGTWGIATQLFEKAAGIKVTPVAYEGGNLAAAAVAGGHVEATMVSGPEVKPLVDAGKLKVLAVMGDEGLSIFPNVPTIKDSGYDLSFGSWRAFVAPKGVSQDIVVKLDASLKKALESPDFKKFMSDSGYGGGYMPPAETEKYFMTLEKDLAELLK